MQAKYNNIICRLVVLLLVVACKTGTQHNEVSLEDVSQDPTAYLESLSKQLDLRNSKTIEGVNYTVQHIPNEMEALKRIEYQNVSEDSLKSYLTKFKNDYSDILYINYRISSEGGKGNLLKECLHNFNSHHDMIYYSSFEFGKDLYAIFETDTIRTNEIIFDPTYEMSNTLSFTISINKERIKQKVKNNTPFTIVIEDRFFKNGILKFELI